MYAHLGRDPHPARLMQQRATRVYRWVERMNRADQDAPEYFNAGTDFLADDSVPDTLVAVLRVLAEDFVPETLAAAEFINGWLAENQPEAGSAAVGRLAQADGYRPVHPARRSHHCPGPAPPLLPAAACSGYSTLHCQTMKRAGVDALLSRCGMTPVLTPRSSRRIVRSDNLEVWQ